jgi:uncharacterized protein (UPF0276 family)
MELSMTLLGVKWSPIVDAAVPLVDIVEVAGWDLRDGLPGERQLLHNLDLDFSLGVPNVLDEAWLTRCRDALAWTNSPWFSLHLGFSSERVRFDGHMLPESPMLDRATCLERMTAAVGFAQRHLDVPMLIENLDYCPEGAYEHVCEPAFITEVVRVTGCDLLLDLAHLQVSADWLGYSPEAYAALLPLERVVEVHLSSPRLSGERLGDVHCELIERDYRLLEWVLTHANPEAVALEYTRDESRLIDQVRALRALLDKSKSPSNGAD